MTETLSELRSREFYSKTVHIMVPVVLQQLITVGINFLDNIMVGGFGETQIAAASLGNQFYSIFQFVTMGLGSGAIVMSSQYWGAGDREHIKTVAAIALRITALLSLALALVSMLMPYQILRIYTNDTAVARTGVTYLRLIGSTMFFAGISSTATYLLRSTGHVKIPLISSCIALVLNLFFNWVFIFGKFGAPRLEIVGAAVGTVIARTFEFLFIFGYFIFKDKNFGFRFKHFLLSGRELIGRYFKFSLPVLFSDFMLGLGLSMVSVVIGHVGETMMAANSIVATANQMLTILNVGSAGAAAVLIGNSIGEGDKEKAYREGVAYIILSILLGIVISLIIVALRSPYLSIYNISEETKTCAKHLFNTLIWCMPFHMLSYITSKGILRGGGDTRFLLVGDIALLWVVSIPFGAIGAFVWNLPPAWVFFLLKLEFMLKGLVCLGRFLTRKWIKEVSK